MYWKKKELKIIQELESYSYVVKKFTHKKSKFLNITRAFDKISVDYSFYNKTLSYDICISNKEEDREKVIKIIEKFK